jgi:hypothetical protein
MCHHRTAIKWRKRAKKRKKQMKHASGETVCATIMHTNDKYDRFVLLLLMSPMLLLAGEMLCLKGIMRAESRG